MSEGGPPTQPLTSRKSVAFDWLFRNLARLPLWLTHWIAASLVVFFLIFPSRHRMATWRNIGLCFPQLPWWRRWWWFVRSLQESIKGIAEMGHFWYRPHDEVLGLICEVDGQELFDEALASGGPVLIGAPHLGAWELLCLYLSSRTRSAFLYREPRDRAFEQLLVRSRERMGGRLLRANTKGVRELVRRARAGDLIGIMPDHQPRRGQGVYAPFFGYKAYTMQLFGKLARRENAQVLLGCAERLPWGRGFRLRFVKPGPALYQPDDLISATELNRCIEQMVLRVPLQYEWTYKRFLMQPDGAEYDYGARGPARAPAGDD